MPHSEFTFETFVVSEASRDAFEAARAVAARVAGGPSPLVLHGPMGCGKSHLLNAIAHVTGAAKTDGKVVVEAIVRAIRQNRPCEVWAADVLLIDDLLPQPPVTLQEIVTRIRRMADRGAQVAVAIHEDGVSTLREQFPGARFVGIGLPDEATGVEIARREAERRGMDLPEEALREVARRAAGDPRELRRLLATVAAKRLVRAATFLRQPS